MRPSRTYRTPFASAVRASGWTNSSDLQPPRTRSGVCREGTPLQLSGSPSRLRSMQPPAVRAWRNCRRWGARSTFGDCRNSHGRFHRTVEQRRAKMASACRCDERKVTRVLTRFTAWLICASTSPRVFMLRPLFKPTLRAPEKTAVAARKMLRQLQCKPVATVSHRMNEAVNLHNQPARECSSQQALDRRDSGEDG